MHSGPRRTNGAPASGERHRAINPVVLLPRPRSRSISAGQVPMARPVAGGLGIAALAKGTECHANWSGARPWSPRGAPPGEFFNRQAPYRPHQRSRLIAWLAIARVRSRDAASHPTPSSARKGIGHGVEAAPLAAPRDRVRRSRWSSDPAMRAASRNGVRMWVATVADRMPAGGPRRPTLSDSALVAVHPIEDSHLTPTTVRSSRYVCVVPSSPNADVARCISRPREPISLHDSGR